mgnify:CR=1 FL=1
MTQQRTIEQARAREAAKTSLEKGQDFAYTLNHMFACFSFDFAIIPLFGSMTQKLIGKSLTPDMLEDKYADPSHKEEGHGLAWLAGELVGDIGAVPVTLAMQRYFPGFMQGIQTATQPLLGPIFRHGADKRARKWALEQGIALDDPRVKAKADEVFQYEVDHLPQAFTWTASSIAINIASQRWMFGNNHVPLWVLGVSKGVATAASAVALLGARSLFPDVVHKSDTWASKHIIQPSMRALGLKMGGAEKTPEHAQRPLSPKADNDNLRRADNDNHAPGTEVREVVHGQTLVPAATPAKI